LARRGQSNLAQAAPLKDSNHTLIFQKRNRIARFGYNGAEGEASSMVGTVYIVGAGPGNRDLITVRGLRCLREADVVLYDRLVDTQLLEESRPNAERIYVGKETGIEDIQQRHTEELMIERARKGQTICRLKGGDPCVFGRGSEEARALREAGVPFEIIPGVSSATAVPVSAGIPVTNRNINHSFMVIAGSRSHPLDSPEWLAARALVKAGGTVVILMGLSQLRPIVESLLAAECPGAIPIAIISNGTLPSQDCRFGSLANIMENIDGVKSPGVIVIGDVVSLRETAFSTSTNHVSSPTA
jgi:uroporphyrin-III C-methyltransferase